MNLRNQLLGVAINFLLILPLVFCNTITQDTVTYGSVLYIEDIVISPGVFWSIRDSFLNYFIGDLDNQGQFYISGDSLGSLVVSFDNLLSSTTNTGLIVFSSIDGITAPTYSLSGVNFNNSGQIYFNAVTPLLTTSYTITASGTWYNGPGAEINFFLSAPPLSTNYVSFGGDIQTINDGQICLINNNLEQTTSISGSGCINVNTGSNFYLSSPFNTVSTTQVIYLATTSSTLEVNVLNLLVGPQYTVAGFGGGNQITFTSPFLSQSYSAQTGILTVSFVFDVYLNIGFGYSANLFKVDR